MQPFLPWPGSKARCADEIVVEFPRQARHYYEPFLGSGAVFFALDVGMPIISTKIEAAFLSDINEDLIGCWRGVRNYTDNVMTVLHHCIENNSEEFYRRMRKRMTNPAIFLYVMRAAFSSMYRVNQHGEFNVPWRKKDFENGRRMDFDFDLLDRASKHLNYTGASLQVREWSDAVVNAEEGDLVYFDPPYVPYSGSGFCEYSANGFGVGDHIVLKNTCERLRSRGVFVALSNSDTEDTRRIYGEPTKRISVTNAIKAKARKKGQRPEGLWIYKP